MWTLILTIIMTSKNFTDIHTIDGFASKEICETAGRSWYKNVNKNIPEFVRNSGNPSWENIGISYNYVCVDKGYTRTNSSIGSMSLKAIPTDYNEYELE